MLLVILNPVNRVLIEILRTERTILESDLKYDSKLTVYVGIYNGIKFLNGIENFLNTSSLRDFNLVIVDNSSTDGSWDILENWVNKFDLPTKVVRNPINLGGGGGFEVAHADRAAATAAMAVALETKLSAFVMAVLPSKW